MVLKANTKLPAYQPYLQFAEMVTVVVTVLAAMVVFGRLLYFIYCRPGRLKVKQLSPSLFFYMLAHSVGISMLLPYHIYVVLLWATPGKP